MRMAKGKGIVGASKFRAIRNIHPINDEKEKRVPRQRGYAELSEQEEIAPRRREHAAPNCPTETIAGQHIYIGSSDEYYGRDASDRSRRSHRRDRRDRCDPRDPERQQLKNIKAKFPPFQGKNDPEAYLEWREKWSQVFYAMTLMPPTRQR
ncbi:unnamed protein product [Cochlearia groenlandica]